MSYAIEIEQLRKSYGDVEAVRGVTMRVATGESLGYLGPNGAGKTTTIRCALGLVRPTSGTIRVLGSENLLEVRAHIGYLPGEFGLWPHMTGGQVLDYLASLTPRRPVRRRELCERFEMGRTELERSVRTYSRGMRQKIGIIQAFQHAPQLVVLDEPTEGLDPLMQERFLELLRDHEAGGGTMLMCSHILSEVELATDRVVVIRRGEIVREGPTRALTGDQVRHCRVVLKRPAPPGLFEGLQAVTQVAGAGTEFTFDVRGDMEAVLRRLAPYRPRDLTAEPEGLAETFYEVYGS